jgi:hypothetical protein
VSARRRHRLVDCNPHFVERQSGVQCAVYFECPEGHEGCKHVIPFTPALDGSAVSPASWHGRDGAVWQRAGDQLESLTLSPSIRRVQRYASREAALADGVEPEHFSESLTCALHIFIRNGAIEFCGDSA